VLKFARFRYHGNRYHSEQIMTITFKQADPQYPHWMQVSELYHLHKVSFSQFCDNIRDLSLPWQHGSVWATFGCHL